MFKNSVYKYFLQTYKNLNHKISHSILKLCPVLAKKIGHSTVINSCFIVVCSNFIVFYICQTYSASLRQLMLSGDIELNPGPFAQDNMIQSSPYTILKSRLAEQGLQLLDVGGAGDCFFRAVSHQLYKDPCYHVHVRTAGVQYMTNNPERFIESNTEMVNIFPNAYSNKDKKYNIYFLCLI